MDVALAKGGERRERRGDAPEPSHCGTRPRGELEDARWFSRQELKAGDVLKLPSPISIARRLIEDWLGV